MRLLLFNRRYKTPSKKDPVVLYLPRQVDRKKRKIVYMPTLLQVFAFDHCFWSMDEANVPKYAGESYIS